MANGDDLRALPSVCVVMFTLAVLALQLKIIIP